MSKLFRNHSLSSHVLHYSKLPIYMTYEFSFFRGVNFDDTLYGKTVSELHHGNLKLYTEGRYSKLFPNTRISYWADSIATVKAEMQSHNPKKNRLMFWAYDDASSTFPTNKDREPLIIIDGIDLEFYAILQKIEENRVLQKEEKKILQKIEEEDPDCLVYKSVRCKDGKNFLFFKKGFNKLSLREVALSLGDRPSKNKNTISCAATCDYSPIIESYGCYFLPIAKIARNNCYVQSDEFISRQNEFHKSLAAINAGTR